MKSAKKKIIRRVTLCAVAGLIIVYRMVFCVPLWQFLSAIHFDIGGYLNNCPIGTVNFSPYRDDFELIAKYAYEFADNRVGFYEDFSGTFWLCDEGIMFHLKGKPEVELYEISDPKWAGAVDEHRDAYIGEFFYGEYRGYTVTENYLSVEGGYCSLVFTRNRRFPTEYINKCWETYHDPVVNVIKRANGWYEINIG